MFEGAPSYVTPSFALHVALWFFSLFSFSTSAAAAEKEVCLTLSDGQIRACSQPYDEDYVHFSTTTGVFVWLITSFYIIVDVKEKPLKPLIPLVLDSLMCLFSMAAASATTDHSDCGQFDFCDTYKASIAFMWFIFFCYIPLLVFDFQAFKQTNDFGFNNFDDTGDAGAAEQKGDQQNFGTAV